MKVKIQLDMSPKELREALGLPDVAGLQADIVKVIKEKIQSNIDDFDPITLFKSFVSQGIVSTGELQKIIERVTGLGTSSAKKRKKTSKTSGGKSD